MRCNDSKAVEPVSQPDGERRTTEGPRDDADERNADLDVDRKRLGSSMRSSATRAPRFPAAAIISSRERRDETIASSDIASTALKRVNARITAVSM
jgi:hypothetical protein